MLPIPALQNSQAVHITLSAGMAQTQVVLGHGILAQAGNWLAHYFPGRLLLVSDEHVTPLYALPLRDALERRGYEAHLLTMPAGEEAKTLDTLTGLYAACHALQVERDDVVIAVGGGVVGDVAGMLAGTYLRGLELVQAPTTLVAQVSSSVGGKVGVDFQGFKNLIGLFKPPTLVLADLDTLASLPAIEFRSGLGELVTVGVLGAPEVFEALESRGAADLAALIAAAIRCKSEIVQADPFDRLGIRARLNLGHTFGHALEKLSGFELAHGLAVAVGLHIASRLAVALGLLAPELVERIRRTLNALDLPTVLSGYSPEQVIATMRNDKKRRGDRIRFVLPVALGQVVLVDERDVPPETLVGVLDAVVGEGTAYG